MKYGDFTLGQMEALTNKLGGMEAVSGILSGAIKVTLEIIRHLIDCDALPFVPKGLEVEKHCPGGKLEWNAAKVALYLSPNQQGNKVVVGNDLRKELADKPVLNACVLDYLLAHPELIPESWKGKAVFFWGTIYRDADGLLYVRYLYWGGDRWYWGSLWLAYDWRSDHPAACAQASA